MDVILNEVKDLFFSVNVAPRKNQILCRGAPQNDTKT